MTTTDKQDNKTQGWHVGKEIPLATIAVLVVQTCGVIWLAASTVAKVDFIKEASVANQIIQSAVDRRQDEDIKRTEDRILAELRIIRSNLDSLILRSQPK